MRARLTKRSIESLQPGTIQSGHGEGKLVAAFLWDTEVRGFGVRVAPGGKRVFVYQYRPATGGAPRRYTIGEHGRPWSLDKALREALRLMSEKAQGKDPARERQATRKSETVADLAERFLADHVAFRTKPATAKEYGRLLKRNIVPKLGRLKVTEVTRADVDRLHHSRRCTPRDANHMLSVMSKMFGLAERWGLRPDGSNPAKNVERFDEHKRDRFLSSEEISRLGAAFAEAEDKSTISPLVLGLFRLLLFTGARLNEIRMLRWEFVDLEVGLLALPDSKTGKKTIRLNAPARAILIGLPRLAGSPLVFPGMRPDRPLGTQHRDWHAIRTAAGMPDLRLHDLRHSYASIGVAGGLTPPLIGRLLGHTRAETTNRYAHVPPGPEAQAAEAIGQQIMDALRGAPMEADPQESTRTSFLRTARPQR